MDQGDNPYRSPVSSLGKSSRPAVSGPSLGLACLAASSSLLGGLSLIAGMLRVYGDASAQTFGPLMIVFSCFGGVMGAYLFIDSRGRLGKLGLMLTTLAAVGGISIMLLTLSFLFFRY